MKITVDNDGNILSYAVIGSLDKSEIEISESILPRGFFEKFRPRYFSYSPKAQVKISVNPDYKVPDFGSGVQGESPVEILETQLRLVSTTVGSLTKNIAIQSATVASSQKQLQLAQKTIEQQALMINTLLQMQGTTSMGLAQVAKSVTEIKSQGGDA